MQKHNTIDISYFPGCSLVSSARENYISLDYLFLHLGFNLVELEGWNCCGSSSAHSIDAQLALDLPSRNLSLASPKRPLLVACQSCLLRLRGAYLHLKNDKNARINYEKKWNTSFDPKLDIVHFFELLNGIALKSFYKDYSETLKDLKFVPYYGCMLAHPPAMRHEKNYHGLMEKILSSQGASPLRWNSTSVCCGTYLSVARPDVVTSMVNKIIGNAIRAGAECIITACAMCQMNLEIRCTLKQRVPIFHFSEILALALGLGKDEQKGWFSRHLVSPKPLLKAINLFK